MRIIIAGAGSVGFHLASLLADEAQDIVLIDVSKERLEYAETHLDISTIRGDSTSFRVLQQANVDQADLLIAVTSLGDTNITTALIGKKMGAKKTIVRIKNMEYLVDKQILDLRSVGIDELISPESLAAREIKRLLKESAISDSFDFGGGKLSLLGLYINAGAPFLGKSLIEIGNEHPEDTFITVAIKRGDETIIPRGKTTFEVGDHAYFISRPTGINRIMELSGNVRKVIKDVMILGGSRTGAHVIRRLASTFNIKLIEKDRAKAFELADQFPKALVINGDGTNVELLDEEGVGQVDAFVAVTGNSETNILSCLVAKKRGVKKTIALVENKEYVALSNNFGIDAMINKKLIAANFIFRYIREGNVINMAGIYGMEAEILEFKVKEGAKVTKTVIKDLKFPEGAIIGGVIRKNHGYITLGDFQIQPNDSVVVFTLTGCVHAVEKFFK